MSHSATPGFWSLAAPRATAAVCAVAGLSLLTSCGDAETADGTESAPETQISAEGTEQAEPTEQPAEGTDETDVAATVTTAPGSPEVLEDEEKLEILLSASDLPQLPEGHSTHTGVSYFQDYIAVEYTQYQETFGDTPCATSMDRINVDLVGQQPLSGLAHAYQLSQDEDEYSPQVYAWVLSFHDQVDTAEIWDRIQEQCGGTQLEAGDESVEISRLELSEDFGLDVDGITMVVHSQNEPLNAGSAVRHSMTVDFGHNLVMLAAVGLTDDTFSTLAEAQLAKLAQHLDSAENDEA
ncbi:hypothetical protein [Nesterenkonia ebinurensis]|uniref:hypothetical protein n=1 Tax=Nesterenkonia ebinurensis TaxID=2608252 RepID=UPI00123D4750|nr:hypothetical protein [Nesterenkonia ebinurensis]